MTMLWIGTQAAIEAAAVLCDEAANAQPQTRGDGTPVPEAERMQMSWAVPKQCPHCALWTLQAPPDEYGVALPVDCTAAAEHTHEPVGQPARISQLELRIQTLEADLGLMPEGTLLERLERLETLL